jgi:hypothetical protein
MAVSTIHSRIIASFFGGGIETTKHDKRAASMFAAGDALAGANIQRAPTDCLRIIGQLDLLVLARSEKTSRAHVFKRISIGVVISYGLDTCSVEIAIKAIPPARNNGRIQKNGDHER